MRITIQDKVSHNFIEGPSQSQPLNNNFQEENPANTPSYIVPTQGQEKEHDPNDIDTAYLDPNERYD